jgi:hypothetical protein
MMLQQPPSSSKRKAGSSASGSVPKKSKAQKAQSRVQSKDRVLDKVKFSRKKKEGKALVWSFFDAGFTVFKNHKDPELKKLVVCETCVANGSPQDAEFNFGGSTTNVEQHIKSKHKERLDDWVAYKHKKGNVAKPGEQDIREHLPSKISADEWLHKLIVNKNLAFNIVDSEEWRYFCAALNSKYKKKTAKALAEELQLLMLEKQQGLRDWMAKKGVKEAAITHDSWSTMLKDTYASLAFHFISEDFDLYSCPFDVKKMVGQTYATCIADIVPTFG